MLEPQSPMNENALNASVGVRLRSLRLARGVKQSDAARDLGVSPAYLNLIEKGKRVMPFPLLWKALRHYEQDPEQFMATLGEGRVDETLAKLLDEPLLKSLEIDQESLQSLSAEPKLAGTVAALFNLYKNTRTQLENVMAQLSADERARAMAAGSHEESGSSAVRFDYSPFDEVSDFLQARKNLFPELEEQAEALRRDYGLERQVTSHPAHPDARGSLRLPGALRRRPTGSSVVRRLDPEHQTLTLSPDLTEQALKFQLGTSLGLLVLDREKLHRAGWWRPTRHAETPRLIRVNLANYFAGALMLPYGDFFAPGAAHPLRRGAAGQHLRHHLRDGGPPPLQPLRSQAPGPALPLPQGGPRRQHQQALQRRRASSSRAAAAAASGRCTWPSSIPASSPGSTR